MSLKLNFAAAKIVPTGEALMTIMAAEMKKSSSGNTMISAQLKIDQAEDETFVGRSTFENWLLEVQKGKSDAPLRITYDALMAFVGTVPDGEVEEDEMKAYVAALVGKQAYCFLKEDEGGEGFAPKARISKYGISPKLL